MLEGLVGLVWTILVIWAVINIIGSSASGLAKILWTLFVIFFPLLGMIVWFFVGPKSSGRIA